MHDDVEASEPAVHLTQCVGDARPITEHAHERVALAAGVHEVGERCVDGFPRAASHHYPRAVVGEGQGDPSSDPISRARDKRDQPRERRRHGIQAPQSATSV